MRDAHHLQQLLDRPILAVGAVQGDEGDVGPVSGELGDEVGPHVDRDRLVAETLERILDARPGPERHLALQ